MPPLLTLSLQPACHINACWPRVVITGGSLLLDWISQLCTVHEQSGVCGLSAVREHDRHCQHPGCEPPGWELGRCHLWRCWQPACGLLAEQRRHPAVQGGYLTTCIANTLSARIRIRTDNGGIQQCKDQEGRSTAQSHCSRHLQGTYQSLLSNTATDLSTDTLGSFTVQNPQLASYKFSSALSGSVCRDTVTGACALGPKPVRPWPCVMHGRNFLAFVNPPLHFFACRCCDHVPYAHLPATAADDQRHGHRPSDSASCQRPQGRVALRAWGGHMVATIHGPASIAALVWLEHSPCCTMHLPHRLLPRHKASMNFGRWSTRCMATMPRSCRQVGHVVSGGRHLTFGGLHMKAQI